MTTYSLHPSALCETSDIGSNSNIGAFTHIHPGAKVGKNCNISSHILIDQDVTIGDHVTIESGVHLKKGITIGNHVFIGANTSFSVTDNSENKIIIDDYAIIGANSTLSEKTHIGKKAKVEPGSVVIKSVPSNSIVEGHPAKIIGYVDSVNNIISAAPNLEKKINPTNIPNVNLHRFPVYDDLRGSLSVAEFEKDIPFIPKRYFLVYDVMSSEIRGEHAHRECHQFLICIKGGCSVVTDNGKAREEIRLDQPNLGLHLPPMVWACQYKYTADAVLLVFASEFYSADDYIRNYDEFILKVETNG